MAIEKSMFPFRVYDLGWDNVLIWDDVLFLAAYTALMLTIVAALIDRPKLWIFQGFIGVTAVAAIPVCCRNSGPTLILHLR